MSHKNGYFPIWEIGVCHTATIQGRKKLDQVSHLAKAGRVHKRWGEKMNIAPGILISSIFMQNIFPVGLHESSK